MSEKIRQSLAGVSETLLIPLNVRARESQRPNPILTDDLAVAMVKQIDYDFSRVRLQRHDELGILMRISKFDSHVCDFLARHPDGVVVHIGCGLDTRFERVDNGRVEWFDLDLPDVIALRQNLIQSASSRYHTLAESVLETGWLEEVSQFMPRAYMFIAEGVLPYFEEAQVKSLVLRLRDHFPGCELVCDARSPFGVWLDNLHLAYTRVKARLHWSIKSGQDLENWGVGIRLLAEWDYYTDEDSLLKAYLWVRRIPLLAKSSYIFHYRLG